MFIPRKWSLSMSNHLKVLFEVSGIERGGSQMLPSQEITKIFTSYLQNKQIPASINNNLAISY